MGDSRFTQNYTVAKGRGGKKKDGIRRWGSGFREGRAGIRVCCLLLGLGGLGRGVLVGKLGCPAILYAVIGRR
jgi:hypothetical protein